MNKNILLGFAGVFMLIAVTGAVIVSGMQNDQTGKKLTNHDHMSHMLPDACQIFTRDDAAAVLGADAAKSGDPVSASTPDMKISNCMYVAGSRNVTVVVNAPLSDAAISKNEALFEQEKPQDAQDIDGYGSYAFWQSSKNSLFILREHSVIVISVESEIAQDEMLNIGRAVADKIMSRIK